MNQQATDKQIAYIVSLLRARQGECEQLAANPGSGMMRVEVDPRAAAFYARAAEADFSNLSAADASAIIDVLKSGIADGFFEKVQRNQALFDEKRMSRPDDEGVRYPLWDSYLLVFASALIGEPEPKATASAPEPIEQPSAKEPEEKTNRSTLKGFRFSQDDSTQAVLKRAGDYYADSADSAGEKFISALNPYYRDDADDEPRRVSDFHKVYSVEHLLSLIDASSGADAARRIREALRFRYEKHEDSGTFYIWELDEERWLLWADLVLFRALEVRHRKWATDAVITAAEAVRLYGLSEATVRMAIRRGQIDARKSGETWLILRADAEARWGEPQA